MHVALHTDIQKMNYNGGRMVVSNIEMKHRFSCNRAK